MTIAAKDAARSVAELVEQRDFLIRSLEDLEREYAAGDVDEEDYRQLRASYVSRTAQTIRSLESVRVSPGREGSHAKGGSFWRKTRRFLGRRRTRTVLTSIAVLCLVAVLTLVAAELAGVRLPGESATGTVNLPSSTQLRNELTEAQLLASSGNLSEAIVVYNTIISQVPSQPEALAYRGWLERLAGIAKNSSLAVRSGDASIAQAIHDAPGYSDARAFEVIVLLEDDHAGALGEKEYTSFLATKPSATLLSAIGPQMALAFERSHLAIPQPLRRYA